MTQNIASRDMKDSDKSTAGGNAEAAGEKVGKKKSGDTPGFAAFTAALNRSTPMDPNHKERVTPKVDVQQQPQGQPPVAPSSGTA